MKPYIDLIEKLSDLDKKRIENYINQFGVNNKYFIGLENWLQNWSHSNQRLYKLLGNQFIKKFDYEFEKNNQVFILEITTLLKTSNFISNYCNFYWKIRQHVPANVAVGFDSVINIENLIKNEVEIPIKYKKENCRQTLQIQAGTKPIRALQKIINYFKDDYDFEGFEDFKLKHSMILNDKKIKGKLCISIHPLDYLTMSDNNSNWTSCMSWKENGCYHIGTVEMMNSNNVLCCYLENQTPFYFNSSKEDEYTWNNKKWRQLVYITKDIIMNGKPYPYNNIDASKRLIEIVKNLAKENLNWNYTYGPERYYDMIYINSRYSMDNNRDWIKYNNTIKHNIIWDTKGMYNDMLNVNDIEYWCYRNKVKRNKIISVSGKAPCLCCGKTVLEENYDYEDDYNERYRNTGKLICDECSKNFFCDFCNEVNTKRKYYNLKVSNQNYRLCECCFKQYSKCPNCKEILFNRFFTCQKCTKNTET